MRVGVEVGGTFTDLVAVEGGRVVVTKVPSTPKSPDIGAFAALTASGIDLAGIEDLGHGSTVATNAVLERKGAAVAFVATAGFRDLLFMQRHDRRNIYDLFYAKPAPPVRRKDCFEAAERLRADGSVETPLDTAKVAAELIPALKEGGYRAVAICLLNAYANPAHEKELASMISAVLPGVLVTCSHQVAREFREFERASTTLLSAYVQPVIDGYLHRFENKLSESGFKGRFTVMQSNGGRLPADAMRQSAITALYSGPAAGVVGATRQAARSGFKDLITFDMGGTSTDVCLVQDGRPSLASETEIDGLPIRTPVLDIVSVGAGGGSIAWVDDGGMLRAGPQSAGADPGPACYGRGGSEPTTTDAHVVIGTIRPAAFLGGRMTLDSDAAHHAFATVATRFSLSVEQAASSALQLADANIVRAIQLVSTERGRDPRDYALVPFGGAGPLHAARIAEELGISTIVVPPNAGVISAYGLVASDYTKFDAVTRKMKLDEAAATEAGRIFAEMRQRLAAQFAEMKLPGDLDYTHTLDMRFVGQAFEVGVEIPAERLGTLDAAYLAELFADAHHRTFMHGATLDRPVEIVTLRVGATLPIGGAPRLDREALAARAPEQAKIFHDEAWLDCARHTAEALIAGQKIVGPAVIEGHTATTWVPPGWGAELDAQDNLILRKS
ncbi:MAG: hydantoinase/oxoprolinase family protein [Reyranella sp.]|jgi:N-methylhydantoinase A|uniref:hydantoinase/oxoprolinase family protein n=1 Tax=Reyranella sp. TaxID=1929291 RepID=UPI0009697161|nr:hydantoinase/oxoprolinase family protein [Reyranella sp.]MBN9539803.1 hydantoinase/oxoprolinase family protein [Alphaproteobacteria bacterium]MBR2813590.1 hydantoinase/oxoprolinase family protein [Reyranella sp.]OJU43112.1 MAG: hydantoinase [Alphaproteobacteria bacterium 65-37]